MNHHNSNPISDSESGELSALVAAAQRGDRSAFDRLTTRFWGMAYSCACQWLKKKDHYLAEDVVQEAFAEAYMNLSQLRVPAAFVVWFQRIVLKHCDRMTRCQRGQMRETGYECVELVPKALLKLLSTLPESQRQTLILYLTGYSQKEIAILVGNSVAMVKKWLYQARQCLRQEHRTRLAELEEDSGIDWPVSADYREYLDNQLEELFKDTNKCRVTSVLVGRHPGGVAVNPMTNRVYVVNSAVGEPLGSLSVLDGDSQSVIGTVSLGRQPRCIAVDPVTNRLYITHYFSRTVWVIDGATHALLARLKLPGNPLFVDVNPQTHRVYVASVADGDQGGTFAGLSVIDGITHNLLVLVPVGHPEPSADGPVCVRVNPVINRIYVGGNHPHAITVIDGGSHTVVATLGMEGQVVDLGVNPFTNRLYVPIFDNAELAVIDENYLSTVAVVRGLQYPSGVEVDAGVDQVYVSHSGIVSAFSGTTNRPISLVSLPVWRSVSIGQLGGIRINPVTHRVYVSCQQDGIILAIEVDGHPVAGVVTV
jgi:DNA-binding beta-propeller fold protein YncE/DNA-directed RNA polymerase specialized sigma24 family protein